MSECLELYGNSVWSIPLCHTSHTNGQIREMLLFHLWNCCCLECYRTELYIMVIVCGLFLCVIQVIRMAKSTHGRCYFFTCGIVAVWSVIEPDIIVWVYDD